MAFQTNNTNYMPAHLIFWAVAAVLLLGAVLAPIFLTEIPVVGGPAWVISVFCVLFSLAAFGAGKANKGAAAKAKAD